MVGRLSQDAVVLYAEPRIEISAVKALYRLILIEVKALCILGGEDAR
jgi:hypothetical protein